MKWKDRDMRLENGSRISGADRNERGQQGLKEEHKDIKEEHKG